MRPAGLADAAMGPIAIYWQQSLEMRMKCVGIRGEGEGSVHFGHVGAVMTFRGDIR